MLKRKLKIFFFNKKKEIKISLDLRFQRSLIFKARYIG